MKILPKAEFLEMPAGTIYTHYCNGYFDDVYIFQGKTGELNIHGESEFKCKLFFDFPSALSVRQGELTLDLKREYTDGLVVPFMDKDHGEYIDTDVQYLIFDREDVMALIGRMLEGDIAKAYNID